MGKPCVQRLRRHVRDYWIVFLAPFLLFGPDLLQGRALFWGTPSLQFIPWWVYAVENLREGFLPLWNPLNGMGAPLLANYQSAFFYPPNALLWVMGLLARPQDAPMAIARGYVLLSALHLAWAGLGMAMLVRRLGYSWLSQVIAGLAFGLSGYLVGRMMFFVMVWAGAWLPWMVLFADTIASPQGWQIRARSGQEQPANVSLFVPGLAVCIAMQLLAGHAQLTWYSLLLAAAWITFGALRAGSVVWKERLVNLLRAWLAFGFSAAGGAAAAAVQLVPTFEYLRASQRSAAVAYNDAMTYSFWPWRLVTLFAPDFFGSPVRGDFWGYASYWEDHLYLGMVPLLLGLATLYLVVKYLRRRSGSSRPADWGMVVFLWLGVVLAFLLALGSYTPVFPYLYRSVPTFAMFQAPARFLLWVAFAMPILAAAAAQRWRSPEGRGLYWFRLATAGTFAVTLGALAALFFLSDVRLTFVRAAGLAGIWALGFGLLTLAIPWAKQHGRIRLWQAGVIVWVLGDLLAAGWGLNPTVNAAWYERAPAAFPDIRAEGHANVPEDTGRVYVRKREEHDLKFKRFLRFNDFTPLEDWQGMRAVLLPNLNLLNGIAMVNNFDPLVPAGFARWRDTLEGLPPVLQEGWLAWSGTGWAMRIDAREPAGVRFDRLAAPRRWNTAGCAQVLADDQAVWSALEMEMTQPPAAGRPLLLEAAQVQAAGITPQDLRQGGCAYPEINLEILINDPDRIVLRILTKEDAWVEWMDTWYPGWQAALDNRQHPLVRSDGNFRAVRIPAGEHLLVMQYRPSGFYFGALSSILCTLLIIGTTLVRTWRKSRRRNQAPASPNCTQI